MNTIICDINLNTLIVPQFIGHNYVPFELLDINDLHVFKDHRRLRVFYNKGLKCEYCHKVGIYLISAKARDNSIHIDVYTEDFEIMTIDHVQPKSKGGTNDLFNLVPACKFCNDRKGNKIINNKT